MKRYLVFIFSDYYPSGGMNDCQESFDELDEAKGYCEMHNAMYQQIFDCFTREIIWEK